MLAQVGDDAAGSGYRGGAAAQAEAAERSHAELFEKDFGRPCRIIEDIRHAGDMEAFGDLLRVETLRQQDFRRVETRQFSQEIVLGLVGFHFGGIEFAGGNIRV